MIHFTTVVIFGMMVKSYITLADAPAVQLYKEMHLLYISSKSLSVKSQTIKWRTGGGGGRVRSEESKFQFSASLPPPFDQLSFPHHLVTLEFRHRLLTSPEQMWFIRALLCSGPPAHPLSNTSVWSPLWGWISTSCSVKLRSHPMGEKQKETQNCAKTKCVKPWK